VLRRDQESAKILIDVVEAITPPPSVGEGMIVSSSSSVRGSYFRSPNGRIVRPCVLLIRIPADAYQAIREQRIPS